MNKINKLEDSLNKLFSTSVYKMVDVSSKAITHRKALASGEIILGKQKKFITNSEKENLTMRKILTIKPAKKNSKIVLNLLAAKRGNLRGILPLEHNINKILGKKLTRTILSETQFTWKMIK